MCGDGEQEKEKGGKSFTPLKTWHDTLIFLLLMPGDRCARRTGRLVLIHFHDGVP